jgi:hypothetical protein
VTGRVTDETGAAIEGAGIDCVGVTGQSQTDGTFTLVDVPTALDLVQCTVRYPSPTGGIDWVGRSGNLTPVAEGVTEVGTIAIGDGLVAYYPFNGNADDESGNGNHGVVYGATLTEDRFGRRENAYRFDGSNDQIYSILHTVKKTYSVSMWARFRDNTSEENQLFYLTRNGYSGRLGYLSTWPIGSRKWHWGSQRWGRGWEDRGSAVEDPDRMPDEIWRHITFVLNDKEISLYVEGRRVGRVQSQHSSDIENYADFRFLMGGTTEGYQWMKGDIDDVSVFNRALTDADIERLYSVSVSLSGPSD